MRVNTPESDGTAALKVLVPFKVVPSPESMQFQPGLNRIVRTGVVNLLNPLDRCALQMAVGVRARSGGEVVAVTMGPPEISSVLDDVAALGVDRIVHLCDPVFAGADTLATARALAQVARAEQADLVVCGRSAMDGGTAQTPAQVAEFLGVPFAGGVVEAGVDGSHVEVVEEHDDGDRIRRVGLPAVLGVEGFTPAEGARGTGLAGSGSAGGSPVEVWDAQRLGGDDAGYGIRGSRTYVQQVTDIGLTRPCRRVSPAEALAMIDEAAGAFGSPSSVRAPVGATAPDGPVLWVVAEGHGRDLHPTSLEGVACAAAVSESLGASVVAVVLTDEPADETRRLAVSGADRVLVGRSTELAGQPPEVMAAALAQMAPALSPTAVIAPWTRGGRNYLPRLAARLGLGLTGDFVGLDTSPHPAGGERMDLVWLKPAWSGSALARVVARTVPSLGTLRPGAVRSLSPSGRIPCGVQEIILDSESLRLAAGGTVTMGAPTGVSGEHADSQGANIETASVVLCIGGRVDRGAAEALREQAVRRGWAFGGTPEAVEGGLVAARAEISLVKRSISPPVFVGVGLADISSLAPARNAGLVVVVGADGGLAGCCDASVALEPSGFASCLSAEQLAAPSLAD